MRKIESNDIWKEEIEFKNLWILPKRLFCNYKNIRREIKIVLSSRAIVPLSVKKKSVASSTIFSAQFSPETELRLRRRKVIKTLFIQFFFFFFFLRRNRFSRVRTINSLDSPVYSNASMLLRCINFTIKGRYNRGYNFISTKQHGTSENSCKFLL